VKAADQNERHRHGCKLFLDAINQFFAAFAKIRKYYHAIEIGSGLLLCAIGVLIFTDRFTIIARWLSPSWPIAKIGH